RDIRDKWIQTKPFNIPARLWKETLRDTFQDIEMYKQAAKSKVRKDIYQHTNSKEERKRLFGLLKTEDWLQDSYLHRRMRHYFKHGKTTVNNQIILDSQCYKWFEHGGKGWIEVTGLIPYKRIAIPLSSTQKIKGTIRLIIKSDCVEVHHTVEIPEVKSCGIGEIGLDRGYTEAFTDSDGERHGEGLGEVLSKESDYLKKKYQNRNKLQTIAEKKPHKADNIEKNNLGRKKLEERKRIHKERVRDIVSKAAHTVVDKADTIIHEDLSKPIKSDKSRTKDQKRRLSGWVRGLIAYALISISYRRGASVHSVNASYTSQVCHVCGRFGERKNGKLYCEYCREEYDDDVNAAKNVKARNRDLEISLWMPHLEVKSILLRRILPTVGTAQPGLQLPAGKTVSSTESELPDYCLIT
ncbi:MAG: zinc ribbon domain-containing protein, partial [Blastocatellia bacterium]|nr:zinc ribbon domain-containing protein [Blastocatellia bacterium]